MGWRRFFRRAYWDRERSRELESYVEHETDENLARGLARADAEQAARRKLGNATRVREEIYDLNSVRWFETCRHDVLYALRAMRQNRALTAVIVITLAIGIGANTAIFSIVDAVLLRPLPYKDSDRLIAVWGELKQEPGSKIFASYGDFKEIEAHAQSFEMVAANTWAVVGQTLMWEGKPLRVQAIPVTQNLFSLLGAAPVQGRTFLSEDLSRPCTVMVSNAFWRNKLGAATGLVNGNIILNDKACTVIGVMPEGFDFFPWSTEVWTLITPESDLAKNPAVGVAIFGRMKTGISRSSAQAEATILHANVAQQAAPASWLRSFAPVVYGLQGEFTWLAGRNLRKGLLVLFGAVAMVLLIACVNIAGLLMSRAAERQRELALRAALGCGRTRIVRQLLTESIVIALLGAVAGTAIAVISVHYFRSINPITLPPGVVVTVNLSVLAFTMIVAVATGLLFGMIPSIKVSKLDLNEVLRTAGPRMSHNWLGSRTGKILVTVEIGLSMCLLVGATLLLTSINRFGTAPLGFRTDHLLVANVSLPSAAYAEQSRRARFYVDLMTRLGALPGVEGATLTANRPLGGVAMDRISIAGEPAPTSEVGDVGTEQVGANFIRVLGLPLLRGRSLDERDNQNAPQVGVVNQRLAEEYFPHQNPVGRQIKIGLPDGPNPWFEIVGVVGNTARVSLAEMAYDIHPLVYRPLTQRSPNDMAVVVRSRSSSEGLATLVQREVQSLDSRIPVFGFSTMDEIVAKNLGDPRFRALLLGIFAMIALALAAVGIYGVLSNGVLQRTTEIGIRMAVGAEARDVLKMVVTQGLALTAAGIVTGLVAALYFSRFLRSMLYGIEPTDHVTLAAASILLLCVALVATIVPAYRASRVDPVVALRRS